MPDQLFKPTWYLLVLHLPLVLFLVYCSFTLSLLWPDMASSNHYWIAGLGSAITLSHAAFLLSRSWWKQGGPKQQAVAVLLMLLMQIVFLYLGIMTLENFTSRQSSWIVSFAELLWTTLSLLLPGVLLLLAQMILLFRVLVPKLSSWLSLLIAILLPIGIFALSFLGASFDLDLSHHFIWLTIISVTLIFLFLLGNGLYGIMKGRKLYPGLKEFVKFLVAFVMPVLGLYFNDYFLGEELLHGHILGNFSHWGWYVVALLNAFLLHTPSLWIKSPFLGRLHFWLEGAGLIFVLYFLFVTIPLLPIAIPLILVVGFGFLLLTPLLLTLLQVQDMNQRYQQWVSNLPPVNRALLFLSFVCFWPAIISFDYYQDRQSLHEALDMMEQPMKHTHAGLLVNTQRLEDALTQARALKDRNPFGEKPILSRFYIWLVLDNLTLSNSKLDRMEYLFLGMEYFVIDPQTGNAGAYTDTLQVQSSYDEQAGAYRTWLHLQVKNDMEWAQEYQTSFRLPQGVFVSNYYLDMEDHREYGILAEEKSATWVYAQIVRTRRDPGLVRYQRDGKVSLHVFPVPPDSLRTTGIEFLHKEPFSLSFDGRELQIGPDEMKQVPEKVGATLRPKVHFLINCADLQKQDRLLSQLDSLQSLLPYDLRDAQVTFANWKTVSQPLSDIDPGKLALPLEGGFNMELALRQILLRSNANPDGSYPLVILLGDPEMNAVWEKSLAPYLAASKVPMQVVKKDGAHWYFLDTESWPETWYKASAGLNDLLPPAFAREPAFSLLAKEGLHESADQRDKYSKAFAAYQHWLWYEMGHGESTYQDLARASMQAGVMSPVTAFLSLESESQKNALHAKQEQIMNGKTGLDPGEDTRQMSEPHFWLLMLTALAMVLVLKYKKVISRLIQS